MISSCSKDGRRGRGLVSDSGVCVSGTVCRDSNTGPLEGIVDLAAEVKGCSPATPLCRRIAVTGAV
jgi:hypothetical protein